MSSTSESKKSPFIGRYKFDAVGRLCPLGQRADDGEDQQGGDSQLQMLCLSSTAKPIKYQLHPVSKELRRDS